MKFGKNAYDELRMKFGVWNRERKERAEQRKHQKSMAALRDQHAHSRFWLLNVPALATICAAVVEWYWAVLFCIEATGRLGMDWSTSVGSDVEAAGAWHFLFDIQNMWVLIGLILATMPIVMLSMIWLPVQFAMRGAGRWRRGSLIAVGILANVLVIVSGTVVMNYNRQDQVREAVVIEQTAAQGRAAIEARLAFEQEQLRLALNNTNPYLNQAANVGAAEWERSYVAQARASNDPRLPMLERALGAARAADARRANIERLTVERAQAAPEAASAANVEDTVGAGLNTFAQYVAVWRPPFVAFICTLIGIFGAWWTLAMLERLNPKDVLRSGWADDAHRIEDLREEDDIVPQPMKPARTELRDANTEELIIDKDGDLAVLVKEHTRKKKGKDGKPVRMMVQPDIPPDETGVAVDGGQRIGSTVEELAEPLASDPEGVPDHAPERQEHGIAAELRDPNADDDSERRGEVAEHPEPPSEEPYTQEELDALAELASQESPEAPPAALEIPHDAKQQEEPDGSQGDTGDSLQDDRRDIEINAHAEPPAEERQPETDPTRLIAAE